MKIDTKKLILLIIAVMRYCSVSTSLARADEKKLGMSLNVSWVSKYIWRGQDFYDDHAAFQPSIKFDLYGTGFNAYVWTSYAGSSGFRNSEAYDYLLMYNATAFEGEKTQTNYAISWLYFDVYDGPSQDGDSQDIALYLTWPRLFGGKIVPVYQLSYRYTARSGGAMAAADIEGFAHLFGFSYDLPFVKIIDNPLTFGWDITYNDGQGSSTYEHDWSHMTWCLSTIFDVRGGSLIPGLYYQTSMEKTINPEDEFWTGVSYVFDF